MDKIWITFLLMIIAVLYVQTSGQSMLKVQLVLKKYAERGSDVALYCENDAPFAIVYKVQFLKGGDKIFEYIKGRNPPYRNYSIVGAEIDWKKVTPLTLSLKNVDYEASGSYNCEVSTDSPIFRKDSSQEPFHVILPQKGPPSIEFAKKQLYYGDMLVANCTTARSKPSPHITWLVNGKPVDDKYVRQLHHTSKGSHRSKQTSQQQQQEKQEKQQLTPPSSVTSQSSLYHGKVIAGTSASSGSAPGLKEFKAVAREVERKASQSMNGHATYKDNGGGSNFQIQPNTGYNNLEGFYNGMRMHHRERDRSGAIGVFNIEGHRQGDEANENGEESDKKTSRLKSDYHTNMYYDNKQQQQQQQHYDSGYRKHHNSYDRKMRRHVNDVTGGEQRKHRALASHSQLAIRITEALTNNVGRIEITCLATIPDHVGPGEQYYDYKTSLIKLDIEQNDLTSPEPSTGSLAHAKSDAVQTSNFQTSSSLCRNLLALQCGIVALLLLYHRRAATAWFLFSSLA